MLSKGGDQIAWEYDSSLQKGHQSVTEEPLDPALGKVGRSGSEEHKVADFPPPKIQTQTGCKCLLN